MTNWSKNSRSYNKLNSRLVLTLEHLNIVHKSLEIVSSQKGPDGSLARHSIVRNSEHALQMLYGHLEEYLRSILAEMYAKKPLEIVNKVHSSLAFHEIVQLGNYESVCGRMIDLVFRGLSRERKTKVLIKNILDKTSCKPDDILLEDAMFYMEIRHLIVHQSSMVDKQFNEVYGSKLKTSVGGKLPISIGLARKAIKAIGALCQDIDVQLIQKSYLDLIPYPPHDT